MTRAPILNHKARIGAVAGAFAGLMIVVSAEAQQSKSDSIEMDQKTIQLIENYCLTSWRNSRLAQDEWQDCTQQVFLELLESMSQEQLATAIEQPESGERRELNRAIWRIGKRVKRRHQPTALNGFDVAASESPAENLSDRMNEVSQAAADKLGPRQGKIFDLLMKGEPVHQIAKKMRTSPARVSDAKYRAIKKLRESFA